ncbi:hypothetical protein P152DRAFT_398339 [Eremomyces bilateralis CBS 781.70]|uniref:RFX-type winged-helix domain-containing protein n=1 Tax=Eremomyces bilateralis CBS 781.70 TaxID=1392243 RepID=A0A6G1G1N7_9PEZI|nr:uncharacterized protein P152DRAFT_398339 [Eremomyces bilateralis CBS 781.70]KAF1812025.1 hypothetical protein P152DRAFT_398339 [Eremomyces bilateralis CBS 781.70]
MNGNEFGSHQPQHGMDMGNNFHAVMPPSVVEPEEKKRKGNSSSATNDKELREMLSRNNERSLKDVATEVINTERTPRAEKSKQLFAMLWLKSACAVAKRSTPRSRVYTAYAESCATERVIPLNPASFGKLVRVIFPGIQTRRLGVRGESKYHYVDLVLRDEIPHSMERSGSIASNGRMRGPSVSHTIDFNSMPRLQAETARFPSQDRPLQSPTHHAIANPPSQGRLFTDPFSPGLAGNHGSLSSSYAHTLQFPLEDFSQLADAENDTISLPNIHMYAPPKTDIDAAEALVALYRTHCTSLVDCVRFCKEKQFFRLFSTFQGTLTVPVQRLFTNPTVAPWIRECDWLMYQKMIRFVSALTLQVAPPIVIKFLERVSQNLHAHITKTFAGHPAHVLEAKLEPATVFAGLLHRLLRVNSTAHAAAALLNEDPFRDQMWIDWVQYVNPKRIMESELPGCGYDAVYEIMTHDIRSMLMPTNVPPFLEEGTCYEDALHASHWPSIHRLQEDTPVDRIATFLSKLPARFPTAPTRTLLQCISTLLTAALREITIRQGSSYNAWWITKVFVDEMSLWLASLGGFLGHRIEAPESLSASPQLPAEGIMRATSAASGSGSGLSSMTDGMSAEIGSEKASAVKPERGSFESVNGMSQPPTHSKNHPLTPLPAGHTTTSGPPTTDTHLPHRASPRRPAPGPDAFLPNTSAAPPQDAFRPPKIHDLGKVGGADMDDSGIGMDLMDDLGAEG